MLSVSLATIFPWVTYANECLFIKRSNELRHLAKELEKAYSARDACSEENGETCASEAELYETTTVLEHQVENAVATIAEDTALSFLDSLSDAAFSVSQPDRLCARIHEAGLDSVFECGLRPAGTARNALYFAELIDEIYKHDTNIRSLCGSGMCGVLESSGVKTLSTARTKLQSGGSLALQESIRILRSMVNHLPIMLAVVKDEHKDEVLHCFIDLYNIVHDASESHPTHLQTENIVQNLEKLAGVLFPNEDYDLDYWDQVRSEEECSKLIGAQLNAPR